MVCRVMLVNPKNNKEDKEGGWSDTYPVCQDGVKSMIEKLSKKNTEKYRVITTINS